MWVQYLEKYSEKAKQQLLAIKAGNQLPNDAPGPMTGLLVKKSGAGDWALKSTPQGEALISPRCPDGGQGIPEPVAP